MPQYQKELHKVTDARHQDCHFALNSLYSHHHHHLSTLRAPASHGSNKQIKKKPETIQQQLAGIKIPEVFQYISKLFLIASTWLWKARREQGQHGAGPPQKTKAWQPHMEGDSPKMLA